MTIDHATVVLYPSGQTSSVGTVVHLADAGDGRTAVVLDQTAFHPVDTAWPDQPSDRGTLVLSDDSTIDIVEAVVGASNGDEFLLGRDVSVRTGTEGWTFVVAHLVEGAAISKGDTIRVEADVEYRAALSAGHTACHLASLALDAALAGAWRKDAPTDALGAPGFDALATQESRIVPLGSRDVYRIGKSLRRKGFDPAVLDDLDAVASRANLLLAEWIAAGGDAHIECDGPGLADRRAWVCALPGATVRIPCGGTHVASLADLSAVTVSLTSTTVEGGLEVVMSTVAIPA
ncbi:metal-dependent hydrolase [Microbacterium lacus]|uniref:metal-dependent hydrolase n=1 Tax=Microbacterium lacus TaxID=415217 RepID=UPI00384F840E